VGYAENNYERIHFGFHTINSFRRGGDADGGNLNVGRAACIQSGICARQAQASDEIA
jgi:hypothetical protein